MKLFRVLLCVVLVLAVLPLSACAEKPRDLEAEVHMPQETRNSTPEEAVRSYLDWVTFAFRTMDSEVATPTMTPDEASRISYYITMNRAEDKILNQRLDSFEIRSVDISDQVALVAATEEWTYNHKSVAKGTFDEPIQVSYEATYTVLSFDGVWRVQSVEATRLEPEQ